MVRDAPSQEVSGPVARKRRIDSSTDDDKERPVAESSRRKKKKKQQPDDAPDMFDSDYKGKLSFSKPSPVKPVSSGRSQPGSAKVSKQRDDDSGLGSSRGEPKKSKKSKNQRTPVTRTLWKLSYDSGNNGKRRLTAINALPKPCW